ncbi:MAG: hypothetical protein IT529_15865 [Burkholderiales bacterium]|nr:hypothetical protein [Burkholderiales bacterium]
MAPRCPSDVNAAHCAFTRLRRAVAVVLLAGCTSVPQATRERDAEAKQFGTHPNSATIYVYRADFRGPDESGSYSVLWVDNRLIGETLPRSYFRVDAPPGTRVLHGDGHDTGRLVLEARSGELHFVSLRVIDGTSRFTPVPAATGRREILDCCTLMENWAPGQRPLLR